MLTLNLGINLNAIASQVVMERCFDNKGYRITYPIVICSYWFKLCDT